MAAIQEALKAEYERGRKDAFDDLRNMITDLVKACEIFSEYITWRSK